jgi:PKD repeat protein
MLSDSRNRGTPFGIFGLWATSTKVPDPGLALFNASHDNVGPGDLLNQISAARAKGVHLLLAMTGGSHEQFKTNGVFDLAKWQAAMDAFNTPAIKSAVADAVADGVIIGNSVMDEPFQADQGTTYREKSWGPVGTMTKARVDGLCAYNRRIFPTMPQGVFHDATAFEPDSSYHVCDFIITQYALRKGAVATWRDEGLAVGRRDKIAIVFSLNILDGGQQDKIGVWDCPNTGGLGTYAPNCHMTPQQIRDWGKVLAPAGCTLLSWRYDAAFMARPENQAALSDVAITASQLPRQDCVSSRGANLPPVPAFTASCDQLTCNFTDGSTDRDGRIAVWSWDFGDGTTSSAQQPSHTYAAAGSYQVTLIVTDDRNAPASVVHTITATPPPPANIPPVAAFTTSCTDLGCSFADGSSDKDGNVSSWSWSFGDGSTSSSQNPSHTFAAAGPYNVQLTVTDNQGATGTVTHSVTVTAPPPGNKPPVAAFTVSCTDLDCSFTDGSTDDDGTVVSRSWDFGDGQSSTAKDPTHQYAGAGKYDVLLTVQDDKGATGTVTHSVTVTAPPPANKPPVAAFTVSCSDLGCDFTGTSHDDDGAIASVSWDFGDGSSSTALNPSHAFGSEGAYQVTLTVTDDKGATDAVTHTVTVTAPAPVNAPPHAGFSASCTDLDCSFTDESTDDVSVAGWSWDFGDNGSATEQNPTHHFDAEGSYQVTLTVTDDAGKTDAVTRTVTVTAPAAATGGP